MARYSIEDITLTNIANAIRNKTNKNNPIEVADMADEISSIEIGGSEINPADATATASDILASKTAYVASGKVTGTIETFDGSYECSGESTGGSGGTNVETCTVTIHYNNTDFGGLGATADSRIYASVLDNDGNIQSVILEAGVDFEFELTNLWGGQSASIVIDNIVKNSILTIIDSATSDMEHGINPGIIIYYDYLSPRIFLINQSTNISLN